MPVTIIYGDTVDEAHDARTDGGALWLSPADLTRATGWELKPEGMCRDEVCIPIPEGLAAEMVRQQGSETWVNLAAFADYTDQPFARDERHDVWSFGESPEALRTQLLSLEAPDFTLSGYDDRTYSLSAFRGKKVVLLLWSSW